MAKQSWMSRIRLQYKRSSTVTRVAVGIAVVMCVLTLVVLHSATLDARNTIHDLRQNAQQLEQENNYLKEQIDLVGTKEGFIEFAKQHGWEISGLIEIQPVQPQN